MTKLNDKSNKDVLLIVAAALMTVALFARDLFGVSIPRFYIIALAVIPALFMNYQSLVCYIYFLFPLTSGISGNIIFPLLIAILLIKQQGTLPKNVIYCYVALAFMELIHYLFYDFAVSWASVVGYLCNLFFLVYFVSMKDDAVDNRKCIVSFCVGLVVFLVAIFYITQINLDVEIFLEEGNRLGDTKSMSDMEQGVMMLNANPNGLGFFSVVGMAAAMVLFYLKKIKLWALVLFMAIYLGVGVLGLSRTFLLSVFLLIAIYFFLSGRGTGRKTWSRNLLLLVFLGVAIYLLWNTASLYDAYVDRIVNVSDDGTGGRTSILSQYNRYLLDNPVYLLFGTGAVHYHDVIYSLFNATHNGLQQILVSYGLVGFVFFFAITVAAFKNCYRKKSPICLVPFIIAFIYVQSGQLLNPSNNLYLFIVAFTVMKLSSDSNVRSEQLTA